MEKEKECFDFSVKKVCKVCGCEDGSCSCHMELSGESKSEEE